MNGDYRLRPGSPAINAGTDQTWMVGAQDVNGCSRLDGAVDVGACEYARGALDAAILPSARSGFTDQGEIVYTAAVEGTHTTGLVYVWDFDADGTVEIAGDDRSVVTGNYSVAGLKDIRLIVSNSIGEVASFTFADVVKIGPRNVYVDQTASASTFPYDAPETAASTVQAAVDAAVDGSVVHVSEGVYRLDATVREDSPAKDMGVYSAWMDGASDLAGVARLNGVAVDCGAYEWHPPWGLVLRLQ